MRLKPLLYGLFSIPLVYAGVALSVAMGLGTYKQDQTENVIITQLGDPVGFSRQPGLVFVGPFYQTAHTFTNKLVNHQPAPQNALTADNKTIKVDYYAEFRIVDPDRFLRKITPPTVEAAQPYIDDVIYSEMRNLISRTYSFQEVATKSEEIQKAVKERVGPLLKSSAGIEIYDIRITTTNPTENVLASVYQRMKAERAQLSQAERSDGQREKTKLTAEADRDVLTITSKAYAEAQKVKGDADASALKIIQDAYSKNPDVAFLLKKLALLEATLGPGDTLVISTESELYRLMKDAGTKR
ncbi:MAG: protease modulator HflC [Candidatus Aenigmarchaeota archaeon]|nr:protease modulator HflC [Candidatus Aenigmarchaeota archaeon]